MTSKKAQPLQINVLMDTSPHLASLRKRGRFEFKVVKHEENAGNVSNQRLVTSPFPLITYEAKPDMMQECSRKKITFFSSLWS